MLVAVSADFTAATKRKVSIVGQVPENALNRKPTRRELDSLALNMLSQFELERNDSATFSDAAPCRVVLQSHMVEDRRGLPNKTDMVVSSDANLVVVEPKHSVIAVS